MLGAGTRHGLPPPRGIAFTTTRAPSNLWLFIFPSSKVLVAQHRLFPCLLTQRGRGWRSAGALWGLLSPDSPMPAVAQRPNVRDSLSNYSAGIIYSSWPCLLENASQTTRQNLLLARGMETSPPPPHPRLCSSPFSFLPFNLKNVGCPLPPALEC